MSLQFQLLLQVVWLQFKALESLHHCHSGNGCCELETCLVQSDKLKTVFLELCEVIAVVRFWYFARDEFLIK